MWDDEQPMGRPKYWGDEKEAWDRYAAHALAHFVPSHIPHDKMSAAYRAECAATLADAMLEERRKRFETDR